MNSEIKNILDIVEDNKEKINDNEYKKKKKRKNFYRKKIYR